MKPDYQRGRGGRTTSSCGSGSGRQAAYAIAGRGIVEQSVSLGNAAEDSGSTVSPDLMSDQMQKLLSRIEPTRTGNKKSLGNNEWVLDTSNSRHMTVLSPAEEISPLASGEPEPHLGPHLEVPSLAQFVLAAEEASIKGSPIESSRSTAETVHATRGSTFWASRPDVATTPDTREDPSGAARMMH
ncbi:hypothetical protein Cgig2_033566 [Carnegiea gigantea]|uniref:Uncharacterized protein n=1 Tax=Carnegiea gigantea TaxID=171969 RepID=A0A9Q1QLS0_9CARY|nr:hypothetical protein Cgig2_033566 [Carnegiea gigantea]